MEEQAAVLTPGHLAHAWHPIVVNRSARSERPVLKVAAFNACSGRFAQKIAERLHHSPLDDIDIVLLSEVDWRLKRSGRREVAADIAAELGMSFAYIPEFGVRSASGELVRSMGNAILSTRPLLDVTATPLTKLFMRNRVLRLTGGPAGLTAKIAVHRKPLVVGIVHLNSRWNPLGRATQMQQYLQAFPREGSAIIGGDLNTTTIDLRMPGSFLKAMPLLVFKSRRFRNPQAWEPLFERLAEAGFKTAEANLAGRATFTFTRFIPPMVRPKLDWIALRGLKVVAGSPAVVPARLSTLAPRFSDHDFVICAVHA
jgi:endonuclease/exonuclease/phosphatase family metal-dependent hydrolase